jgi:hypothetical protein
MLLARKRTASNPYRVIVSKEQNGSEMESVTMSSSLNGYVINRRANTGKVRVDNPKAVWRHYKNAKGTPESVWDCFGRTRSELFRLPGKKIDRSVPTAYQYQVGDVVSAANDFKGSPGRGSAFGDRPEVHVPETNTTHPPC